MEILSLATSDILGIVGIVATVVVAVAAVCISLRLYQLQTQQGERIGLMVWSTVISIQRRLPVSNSDDTDYLDEPDDFSLSLSHEPKERFIKRGKTLRLKLTYIDSPWSGSYQCEVVSPTYDIHRSEWRDGDQIVFSYPEDFPGASTTAPGVYHVTIWELEEWTLSGKIGQRRHLSMNSSFGVLP
ncbi:MAG: hypothetical protein GEU75_07855 [Dehalococcoidia bacterium]|nr:hypothetical protein [Dehalococcoidia bacterium]